MQQKLSNYMSENRMHCMEGERGVKNLEKVMTEVCGYDGDWGGVLRNFFTDNSGAIEAVIEWIGKARVSEWSENLDAMQTEDDPMDDAYELSVGD
jgi:hypothetical protein